MLDKAFFLALFNRLESCLCRQAGAYERTKVRSNADSFRCARIIHRGFAFASILNIIICINLIINYLIQNIYILSD